MIKILGGIFFLSLIWLAAVVIEITGDFTIFESFVIMALSAILINLDLSDKKK